MGWTSGFSSLAEIKEHFLRNFNVTDGPGADWSKNHVLLKSMSTKYGTHMWFAVKNIKTNTSFIAFYLCQRFKSYGDGPCWGYKDMDESVGPYEIDCPLELLDLTEATAPKDKHSIEWRQRVRAYHAHRKAVASQLAPGKTVMVYGKPYTLVERINKQSWRVRDQNGCVYKCSQAKMKSVQDGAVSATTVDGSVTPVAV